MKRDRLKPFLAPALIAAATLAAPPFWSVIVYSNQTRSMLQTDQRFPSVSSHNKDLLVNV